MLGMALLLWKRLPVLAPSPAAIGGLRYRDLIASMFKLLREEKLLQVRGLLAMLMFAAFNISWSALVLPLSAAPFHFSHTTIGAFGLVGVIGALMAVRAGQWADCGHAQRTSAAALMLLLLAWWPLSQLHASLWALVLGIVLGDLLEKNLRRALILSDGDLTPFFTRPISAVVAALIFATIGFKVFSLYRQGKAPV